MEDPLRRNSLQGFLYVLEFIRVDIIQCEYYFCCGFTEINSLC